MKKKIAGIPTYYWFIVIGICLVGLLLGTIFDYDISLHLAYQATGNGEWLARFMEGIGQFLGYGMIPLGCTLIFSALLHNRPKWATAIGWVMLIAGIVVSTYMYGDSFMDPDAYPNMKPYFAFPLAFFIMGGIAMLTFFLLGIKDKNLMLRVGIAIMAAMVIHFVIVNGLKFMASRPRFRFIYAEGGTFVPWYQWNPFACQKAAVHDTMKSFPSGHTACTAITLMAPTIVLASGKGTGKNTPKIIFWGAFVWTWFMAFCRILAGAHYLSDVSMGFLVSTICCYLAYFFVLRNVKEIEYVKVDGATYQKVHE